jgi:hypothetical protein
LLPPSRYAWLTELERLAVPSTTRFTEGPAIDADSFLKSWEQAAARLSLIVLPYAAKGATLIGQPITPRAPPAPAC